MIQTKAQGRVRRQTEGKKTTNQKWGNSWTKGRERVDRGEQETCTSKKVEFGMVNGSRKDHGYGWERT